MSEYVRKQALVEWLDESIQTLRGLAIGFRNQGNELAERGCHRDADGLYVIMKKIQSGAFDAPDGEVQRLRAIEQAIRDFQPTTEQQAGYDALVAWLESTTPFVLEPIEALSGARKEDQE